MQQNQKGENMKSKLLTAVFLICTSAIYGNENIIHRVNNAEWKAWGNNASIQISRKKEQGKEIVVFRRSDGKSGWNTPMYTLPHEITVNAFTLLKFRCKAETTKNCELNIKNASEGAEYAVRFNCIAGQWTENAVLLKDAQYKRFGREGVTPDGIMGDRISQIQFACSGKEVGIAEVRIIEIDPSEVSSFHRNTEFVDAYLKQRRTPQYRQFRRNAVFPFGVISTIGAGNSANAAFFGQTARERMEDDLRDIRLRGFNTYSNFVDSSGYTISERLDLMKKYHLHLLETATCGTGIHQLPENSPLLKEIRENASHPNLLAWYGQDEPGDGALYLKNKVRVETLSGGGAPLTSAMHMMSIAQELGPAMDVIMLDPYSLNSGIARKNAASVLEKHAVLLKMALGFCAGKRVWMIPQAFSCRNGGKKYLRYPTPAEARFDVFHTLAAGANGYIFFIYNDTVPYLDGRIRGEEFDTTLVDAWGNGNPTTDALSNLAFRLTAIMPSFLERKRLKKERIATASSPDLEISQWDNGGGILLIAVNRNLLQKISVSLNVELKSEEKLYDLDTLHEIPASFTADMVSGDAKLLFAGTPTAWKQVKDEITERQRKHAKEIASLQWKEPAELAAVRKAFGKLNHFLTEDSILTEIDGRQEWSRTREKIKALSKRYFDARREWKKSGKVPAGMSGLKSEVEQILAEERERFR